MSEHTESELEIVVGKYNHHKICKKVMFRDGSTDDVDILEEVDSEQALANAQHLVKCWNSHDDLVAALALAEKELEKRYQANQGSPIDKLTLKIITEAIAKTKE